MENDGDSGAAPRVERNEDGDLFVRADGRLFPAVEQYETGDGVTGVSRCPYSCQSETHIHSVEPGLMGHRVSHCPEKAEDDVGYFLLRVQESLLGLPFRWWEHEASKPTALEKMEFMGDIERIRGFFGSRIAGMEVN